MAAIRWIVAGGLLIAVLKLRGERMPDRREWRSLTVLSILLLGVGNGTVVWAELTVPSGLTAVLVADRMLVQADGRLVQEDGMQVRGAACGVQRAGELRIDVQSAIRNPQSAIRNPQSELPQTTRRPLTSRTRNSTMAMTSST